MNKPSFYDLWPNAMDNSVLSYFSRLSLIQPLFSTLYKPIHRLGSHTALKLYCGLFSFGLV